MKAVEVQIRKIQILKVRVQRRCEIRNQKVRNTDFENLKSGISIQKPADRVINLREIDAGEFEHIVRHSLRTKEWRAAASRRSDMQGIQDGINEEATQAYMHSVRASPLDKSL